jgi:hypothetical protein
MMCEDAECMQNFGIEASWNGKQLLRRPRRRWVATIKMALAETGYEDGKWMEVGQDCIFTDKFW